MKRNYYKIIFVFAIAVFGFYYPNTASAITLTPTRFELRGDPGETITEDIILINETQNIETFYSSFVNFEAAGESGNPAFVEPKDGIGTWMSTQESITILPSASETIPLTIKIPKNAEPGGYFGVVFFGTSPKAQGGQVSIGANTGILVLLSVNGEVREEAGLFDFGTDKNKFFYKTLPVSFTYRFTNEGNDRIKPQGKITLLDTIFIPADKIDANPVDGNVLPGSTRKFKVDWIKYERPLNYIPPSGFFKKYWSEVVYEWKNFAIGLYSAHLNVSYGTQKEHARDFVFFFVFPWELFIVMLLVLIIAFFGGKKLIKKYNSYIIKKAKVAMESARNS